jgi:hypothetical protein
LTSRIWMPPWHGSQKCELFAVSTRFVPAPAGNQEGRKRFGRLTTNKIFLVSCLAAFLKRLLASSGRPGRSGWNIGTSVGRSLDAGEVIFTSMIAQAAGLGSTGLARLLHFTQSIGPAPFSRSERLPGTTRNDTRSPFESRAGDARMTPC